MRSHFTVLAAAALLVFSSALPGHAEDAATPKAQPAPAAAQTTAPPASVARPSAAPTTTAQPASPPAAAAPAGPDAIGADANGERRYAGHRRHLGRYRIAHWRPFSLHLPRFHRHRIHWRRI
jgi:hypothetical protein